MRSGGVLLISDSSDSEDDRSGTSDGMRPVESKMMVEAFEFGTGAGAEEVATNACGWRVAPCATARVDLRFLASHGSLEGV